MCATWLLANVTLLSINITILCAEEITLACTYLILPPTKVPVCFNSLQKKMVCLLPTCSGKSHASLQKLPSWYVKEHNYLMPIDKPACQSH